MATVQDKTKAKEERQREVSTEAQELGLKPGEEAQGSPVHETGKVRPSGSTEDDIVEVLPVPKQRPLKRKKKRSRFPTPHRLLYPPLDIEQILGWADAHFQRTGEWPHVGSGLSVEAGGLKWRSINGALVRGLRGLPGGSSIAKLLAEYRGKRNAKGLPPYTPEQILEWADAYFHKTGRWPTQRGGAIPAAPGETWAGVEAALSSGFRGLPGGSSIATLLAEHRGHRNLGALPPFTEASILAWAEAHYQRTEQWPHARSGAIEEAPGETWGGVNGALLRGHRGLPGGSSLAKLLAQQRGVRGVRGRVRRPRLTEEQILQWADTHHQHTGQWPKRTSGAILGTAGERWAAIQSALHNGRRGLPGGSSLSRLLYERRGVSYSLTKARLSESRILAWADTYHQQTGRWPTRTSGEILGTDGETWAAADAALIQGARGLPGGSSLAQLLAATRGVRNEKRLPLLTEEQILAWADAHHQHTGRWPKRTSGEILGLGGETWSAIDAALIRGSRGLPGGSSLSRLLYEGRGIPHHLIAPHVSESQILVWADAYRQRHGRWPQKSSGDIPESPGYTWLRVDNALRRGLRGLPGGSSLKQLLDSQWSA